MYTHICMPAIITVDVRVFDGCIFEVDEVWGIAWPNTPRGTTASLHCPSGSDVIGKQKK